jgi:hypothetical protein
MRISRRGRFPGLGARDDEVLHITAEPVEVEIKFQRKTVQLFAAAPIRARMLFTRQRKAELKEQFEAALKKAKFIAPEKGRKPATRKGQKSAAGKIKKATKKSRNRSAARRRTEEEVALEIVYEVRPDSRRPGSEFIFREEETDYSSTLTAIRRGYD